MDNQNDGELPMRSPSFFTGIRTGRVDPTLNSSTAPLRSNNRNSHRPSYPPRQHLPPQPTFRWPSQGNHRNDLSQSNRHQILKRASKHSKPHLCKRSYSARQRTWLDCCSSREKREGDSLTNRLRSPIHQIQKGQHSKKGAPRYSNSRTTRCSASKYDSQARRISLYNSTAPSLV